MTVKKKAALGAGLGSGVAQLGSAALIALADLPPIAAPFITGGGAALGGGIGGGLRGAAGGVIGGGVGWAAAAGMAIAVVKFAAPGGVLSDPALIMLAIVNEAFIVAGASIGAYVLAK